MQNDSDGGSRVVILPPTATVLKSVAGTGSDIVAGEEVMITGSSNSDGSFTAQSVQIRPQTGTSTSSRP